MLKEPQEESSAQKSNTGQSQAENAAKPTVRRRRRAASRPAGPPVEVSTDTTDVVQTKAAGEASVVEAAPAKRSTRRATKPAGEASSAPAKRTTRRTSKPADEAEATPAKRSTRKTAESSDEAAPAKRTRKTAAQKAEETAETKKPATRRRKSTKTDDDVQPAPKEQSEPEAQEQPKEDDTLAELDQALAKAKSTHKRKTSEKEPVDEAKKKEMLDSLVAAIASDEAAADKDETPAKSKKTKKAASSKTEAAEEKSEEETSAKDDSDNESDSSTTRRRRRRGGRRRRRTSEDHDNDQDEAESSDSSDSDDDSDDTSGTTRRRRRRRRRGEDTSGDDDNDADVIVKVRDPKRKGGSGEITGIDGSTRLAAKRKRRSDSRAAGRRRAPVVSEAEFLARRESVKRQMVIRQSDDYTQLAVLEDNVLVEHYVDRESAASLIGNIYLGKVQNVLPSMEAAFIDIGRGRNAVLYAGEVDWESFGVSGQERKFENAFKSGQSVLVQVTKDPVGTKGARLTSHISIPGRYIVYSPGGHLSGISRKLPSKERERLRDVLSKLIGDNESVIVRTAAESASEDELIADVNRLKAQWEVIEKKTKQGGAPKLLYSEPDLTLRIVRDLFTEDFAELVIQGNGGSDDAYDTISAYLQHVAPSMMEKVRHFKVLEPGEDAFHTFRIDEQISKALERKVFLPSGGSLVIDRTEAMTVIDVNTGKFTGTGGNLEETVTSNNLEAAEEIVRQLRLRDIGGIVVIDFIDMVLPSNRELLLRRLVECLGRDRTRHQVAEVTSLGLVQLTRKRIGTGLAEAFTEECTCCGGRGYSRSDHPVESQAQADGGERHHKKRGHHGKNKNNHKSGKNGSGEANGND